MDRFDTLQLFVRIVEQGSFTKGASMGDIPRATATYAIKALEARLGTRLLERTTRHVRPTLDGQAFYERCVRILSEIDDAESSFSHQTSNPRGVLRLDLHGTHATRIVLPRIDEFRARYPGIELVVSSGDRLVDLVREGVDCVIRGGRPRDPWPSCRRSFARAPPIWSDWVCPRHRLTWFRMKPSASFPRRASPPMRSNCASSGRSLNSSCVNGSRWATLRIMSSARCAGRV